MEKAETIVSTSENLNTKNGNFVCGVVEGFYGRPWTTEQRKDLFQKMKKWGMDSYVYAPKDDYKHRAYWRELYTVEEAEHLTGLIQAAKDQNIVFYYALSPGLDITYSSPKDITALKRKLEQVSQFGCSAFSLLFDDIEPEMSEADKEVFQSFAQAQVSVTNEVYQHLLQPKFLVCPTQYCSTRAVPNVTNSEYLNTLGSKLATEIDILWTGSKVITRTLTKENIQEISEVLRRPPVIWDNIHANDYDQKRVFLGPYSGRSPDLIPKLRGVLTNPNCEYGANFVAIHTLAQWSKCSVDGQRDLTINDSVSADIKLETETEDGLIREDVPATLSPNMYHPKQALKNAIKEWLPEFDKHKSAWGPIAKPQPALAIVPVPIIPSINTCMSLMTSTTNTTTSSTAVAVTTNHLQALAEACQSVTSVSENFTPTPGPVMNSLVSETKVVCNESIPNPLVPVLVPIPLGEKNKSITVLNGMVIKPPASRHKEGTGDLVNGARQKDNSGSAKEENVMNTDTSSIESSLSPSEPMDCNSTPNISPAHVLKPPSESTDDVAMSENSTSSGSMQVEPTENSQMVVESQEISSEPTKKKVCPLTYDDLALLCDLFYLPFEHGAQALQLLQEFNWLKSNAHVVVKANQENDQSSPERDYACAQYYWNRSWTHGFNPSERPFSFWNEDSTARDYACAQYYWNRSWTHGFNPSERPFRFWNEDSTAVQEWFSRAGKLKEMSQAVNRLFKHISAANNRELLYDLYAYIWDMRGVISLLNAYVKWLANGHFPAAMPSYTQGTYTWFSKGWKETFMSGEQEPWVFRGGLTADLQRLIPVDSGNDLFIYKVPDVPSSRIYTIRPYLSEDEAQVYSVCTRTCKEGLEDTHGTPTELKNVCADRIVGPYLTLSPEFCFVLEANEKDEVSIVGYACAAPDDKQFRRNQEQAWIPEMCQKYPQDLAKDASKLIQDYVSDFHNFKNDPVVNSPLHPSSMICSLLPSVLDQSASKRLVTCLLAALRANGSFGVHTVINATDSYTHSFYGKLGFVEHTQDPIKDLDILKKVLMGSKRSYDWFPRYSGGYGTPPTYK